VIRTLLFVVIGFLFVPAALADPSHIATVCSNRFQGPCGVTTGLGTPLQATVVDDDGT